ncbi:CvpA family protein [Streptococcus sciuri]|uniref:CvpA family protein n=1 Tax=Streptococcus sciuri TaxID=2973939 RepID=A0ABT2F704_9STRE|nr:CvpA family protein [Streptococcus sciuri]MCS4488256.1 CvpA family protein [Streptococcus sciuri]
MLTMFLFLILVWAFYIGYSRGFGLQVFYTLSSLLALVVANLMFKELATHLTLWIPYSNPTQESSVSFFQSVNLFDLDRVYYAGVAFVGVYVLVYGIGRLLGIFAHLLSFERFDSRFFAIIGGMLSVGVSGLSLGLLLSVLATVPIVGLQHFLSTSILARFFIYIVSFITNSWI